MDVDSSRIPSSNIVAVDEDKVMDDNGGIANVLKNVVDAAISMTCRREANFRLEFQKGFKQPAYCRAESCRKLNDATY